MSRLKGAVDIQALVVGEEVCPSTQKTHFQGYVRFKANKRFSWWKNQFPSVHAEVRKGTEAQAADYCRKEGRVIIDYGCTVDVDSGGSPAEHVLNMLEAGAPLWQVYKAHRVFFFHQCRKIQDMEALMKSWKECGFGFETNPS